VTILIGSVALSSRATSIFYQLANSRRQVDEHLHVRYILLTIFMPDAGSFTTAVTSRQMVRLLVHIARE